MGYNIGGTMMKTATILTLLAIVAVSMFTPSAFAFDATQFNMTLTDAQTTSFENFDIITLIFSLFNNDSESVSLTGHNMLYLNDTSDTQWEYTSHIDLPTLSSTDCPVLNATIPAGQSANVKQCFMVTNATDIGYDLVLNNNYYMMDWETNSFVLESVPDWFKTTAASWCSDAITEFEFTTLVQSNIQDDNINVMRGQSGLDVGAQTPGWVKSNACLWSTDQISDYEFLDGIYWLIDNGKIQLD